MAHARIYQKTKSTMQSGRAGGANWILQYEQSVAKRADPLMGWAGSGDTREQVRLTFPSLEAARAYADANGITAHVVPAAERSLKLQAYADNFKGVDIE